MVETLTEPVDVEILSQDCCRPVDSTTPLTFDKLQQFPIKVDVELIEYFKKPEFFKDLIDAVGNIHVEFNESEGNLVVWVRFVFLLTITDYFRAISTKLFVA